MRWVLTTSQAVHRVLVPISEQDIVNGLPVYMFWHPWSWLQAYQKASAVQGWTQKSCSSRQFRQVSEGGEGGCRRPWTAAHTNTARWPRATCPGDEVRASTSFSSISSDLEAALGGLWKWAKVEHQVAWDHSPLVRCRPDGHHQVIN